MAVSLSVSFLISFFLFPFVNIYQAIYGVADFNFAAVGDWDCTSDTNGTVNNIVGKNPEFVLGLGDYSYLSTGTCWFDKIAPIDSITKIAIGNHDNDDAEGFDGYMSHFGLSQTYYSYDYQNVHFLVMDTDKNSYSSGSAQYNFVVNDLQSASQNPNVNWIIVYYHKAMYTSPSPTSGHPGLFNLRDTYHALFDQYGVDLVLQAHVHNYQRTFPLKYNPNNPSNPISSTTDANDYTNPEGIIFAIVGTGGVIPLHPLVDKASFTSSQQDDFYGQLDITIANNGNKLKGAFYRNGDNAILDSFSITKIAEGRSGN
jgi:hypothetical protein